MISTTNSIIFQGEKTAPSMISCYSLGAQVLNKKVSSSGNISGSLDTPTDLKSLGFTTVHSKNLTKLNK
jgi:hypothetical protein